MQYISQLNLKGIVSGVISFIILYVAFALFTSMYANSNYYNHTILTILGYGIYLLSGYIAGFVSKKSGVLNGAVAGILTPIIMAMYFLIVFGNWESTQKSIMSLGLFWLYTGFLLCGVGGLIHDLQKKFI